MNFFLNDNNHAKEKEKNHTESRWVEEMKIFKKKHLNHWELAR